MCIVVKYKFYLYKLYKKVEKLAFGKPFLACFIVIANKF